MDIIKTRARDIGNSKGLIIPKDILDQMNLDEEGNLFIVRTRDGFEVRPSDPEFHEQVIVAARGMRKFRNALRTLADK